MKKHLALAFAVLAFAPIAAAASPQPLIVKSNNSGFTHPDWARPETCEVFANRVKITRGFGYGDPNFTATESRSITLTPSIAQVIAKAALETIKETDNGLCDGPSTSVTIKQGADDLVLFATGGCGIPRQERDGVYSRMLRDLVDLYCPTTHDFARD